MFRAAIVSRASIEDRIADDAARPGVEYHGDIDEADRDRDVGDVGDPQLIGAVDDHVLRQIGEDRLIVVAVGRRHMATARFRLQAVLLQGA